MVSCTVPRRALATWLLWREEEQGFWYLTSLQCLHVSIPLYEFPLVVLPAGVMGVMRLMEFLTGLHFPQILITVCRPEKGLTYIMLLQFGTALSSKSGKTKWSWLQKGRSWCWVKFRSNFQLSSTKLQIFFCAFFLLNKSINYLCRRFPLESSL